MEKKNRPPEPPHVQEAQNELILRFGNEVWLYDSYVTIDSAGVRLLVEVVDLMYLEDYLPRKLKDCFLVVVKVDGGIMMEQ